MARVPLRSCCSVAGSTFCFPALSPRTGGTFLVRRARLFVRPRVLLIARVADGFFRERLERRGKDA
jgi:hypothetical protein